MLEDDHVYNHFELISLPSIVTLFMINYSNMFYFVSHCIVTNNNINAYNNTINTSIT